MNIFTIATHARSEMIDITDRVAQAVQGVPHGLCLVFVSHTTAGITINENADPTVKSDILRKLDQLVPWDDGYAHAEGNSAAHVKTSLMGSSAIVPVEQGTLQLGTWQGIYLCEFDGPRQRTVNIQVLQTT